MIWDGDEDYKKGNIKIKDTHEYMYADAKKET